MVESSKQKFPRTKRLRKRAEFLRVQSTTSRVVTSHFVLLLSPGPTISVCRLGITVTRKVGCAVVRNRAKRLIREAFRVMPGFVPDGIDMVVVVRKPLTNQKLEDVVQEWSAVARQVARRATLLLRSQTAPNLA